MNALLPFFGQHIVFFLLLDHNACKHKRTLRTRHLSKVQRKLVNYLTDKSVGGCEEV